MGKAESCRSHQSTFAFYCSIFSSVCCLFFEALYSLFHLASLPNSKYVSLISAFPDAANSLNCILHLIEPVLSFVVSQMTGGGNKKRAPTPKLLWSIATECQLKSNLCDISARWWGTSKWNLMSWHLLTTQQCQILAFVSFIFTLWISRKLSREAEACRTVHFFLQLLRHEMILLYWKPSFFFGK